MWNFLERTGLVLGVPALERLQNSRAALLGLGGVGSAAAEALRRMGVGHLLLMDSDAVAPSNLNRQLLATWQAVGRPKTEAARERLLSINPELDLAESRDFLLPENGDQVFDWRPDVVLDAVDTVTTKLYLAQTCQSRGIPLISCMGTGNRIDPSRLKIGDLSETSGNGCPLARVMRRELKKRGVGALTVVFSEEHPAKGVCADAGNGRHAPGSTALVPPVAGYLLAYGAVRALLGEESRPARPDRKN